MKLNNTISMDSTKCPVCDKNTKILVNKENIQEVQQLINELYGTNNKIAFGAVCTNASFHKVK